MSAQRYYFNESIEDDNIKYLIDLAKYNVFKHIDYIKEMYKKHSDVEFGPPPRELLLQISLSNRNSLSPSSVKYRKNILDRKVASSTETLNQASPKLLEINYIASGQPRRLFQTDSEDNETLLNSTSSKEKQSHPGKDLNATDHIEAQNPFPVDEAIQSTIPRKLSTPVKKILSPERLTTRKRKKDLTLEKKNGNKGDFNFSSQQQADHNKSKLVDNLETVNFVPDTSVRQRAVSNIPKMTNKVVSQEIIEKCNSSTSQSVEITGNLELEKKKSVERKDLHAGFSVHGVINESYRKEVKHVFDLTKENERNRSLLDETNARSKRKSVDPNENSRYNANAGRHEEIFFSPIKRVKIPEDTSEIVEKNRSSNKETKMMVCSDKDRELNIKTNQEFKVSEVFESKRKLPSQKRNTMPLRTMPRFIQTSQRAEIEFCDSSDLTKNLIPTVIPTSSSASKKVAASASKKTLSKDIRFGRKDSKVETSPDLFSSLKSNLTCFPTKGKTQSQSIDDMVVIKKDKVLSKRSKSEPAISGSFVTATSPKSFKGSSTTKNISLHASCSSLDLKHTKGGPDRKNSSKNSFGRELPSNASKRNSAKNMSLQTKYSTNLTSQPSNEIPAKNRRSNTESSRLLSLLISKECPATKSSLATSDFSASALNQSKVSLAAKSSLETTTFPTITSKLMKSSPHRKSSSEIALSPPLASNPSEGNPVTNISCKTKCSKAATSKPLKNSPSENCFVKTTSCPELTSLLPNENSTKKSLQKTAASTTLASKTLKRSPLGNKFSQKSSSSTIRKEKSNTFDYDLKGSFDLLNLQVVNFLPLYNYLKEIQKHLKQVWFIMNNMQYIVQFLLVYKNCGCKRLRDSITEVVTIAPVLLEKIGRYIMDADREISICDKYVKEALENKTAIEQLMCICPITNKKLKTRVKELEIKVSKINEIISDTAYRKSIFLSTAVDLVKFVNLFINCLIAAEILKKCEIQKLILNQKKISKN